MDRTQLIFEWIFSLDSSRAHNYALWFLASNSTIIDDQQSEMKSSIIAQERNEFNNVKRNYINRLRSMKAVWSALHHDHKLYTAESRVRQAEMITQKA